ncbi:hypothetical protein C5167_005970 [Papaver somniferum]|uniref:Uncharacterized protein n=1 Tax=Papaver somniferum TaxID=3469 RepID=A0A4Y7JBZ7_PAPSO|nr:hypothetical protein C5167_005970 [Papaver somniferum]
MGTKRGKVETALEDFDNMPGRNSISPNWYILLVYVVVGHPPKRSSSLNYTWMKEITVSRSKVPSVVGLMQAFAFFFFTSTYHTYHAYVRYLHGCRHSLPDGLMRVADVMVDGEIVVAAG